MSRSISARKSERSPFGKPPSLVDCLNPAKLSETTSTHRSTSSNISVRGSSQKPFPKASFLLQQTTKAQRDKHLKYFSLEGHNFKGNMRHPERIPSELCKVCCLQSCRCLKTKTTSVRLRKKVVNRRSPLVEAKTFEEGNSNVVLIKSQFVGRPPVVLFDYPPECKKPSKISDRCFRFTPKDLKKYELLYKMCNKTITYSSIVNALEYAGFVKTEGPIFNIMIGGLPKTKMTRALESYQKYNHFPGGWELGRKDNLWRNVWKLKRRFPNEFQFCPSTYVIPEDYETFKNEQVNNKHGVWILKPNNSACGRGIKLINSKTKVNKRHSCVISKYISNPHTLNGFKYDLRVYVLVTSFDPLKVYMYKEGLVRLATKTYCNHKSSLKESFVHLTNYSINKFAENYTENTSSDLHGHSFKWSFEALKKYYENEGMNYDAIMTKIKDIIIKTLISVEPEILNNTYRYCKNRSCCFELYGFDILIDRDEVPWLLETNISPSLRSSSEFDARVKTSLICDALSLVGINPVDRKAFSKQQEQEKQSKLIRKVSRIPYKNPISLSSCEDLLDFDIGKDDLNMLFNAFEEFSRTGNFERVFPVKETVKYYQEFFESERFNNILLWRALFAPQIVKPYIIK